MIILRISIFGYGRMYFSYLLLFYFFLGGGGGLVEGFLSSSKMRKKGEDSKLRSTEGRDMKFERQQSPQKAGELLLFSLFHFNFVTRSIDVYGIITVLLAEPKALIF